MRFDRALSVHVFHPLRRVVPALQQQALPILMYHSISDEPEHRAAYYKVNTSPAAFECQMRFLKEQGYETLSVAETVRFLGTDELPSGKRVIITFDDGFRNFYSHAFPILQQYGFSATMFLPTSFIGDIRKSFKGIECMTWTEVRELQKMGIEFGSHTVTHPELVRLSWNEIEVELHASKHEMEAQLQTEVRTFAYPFAFPQSNAKFVDRLKNVLAEEGYSCCLTTELGRVRPLDDVYRMKRLPVNSEDDGDLLRAKLEGGYDWLAVPQAASKKLGALKSSLQNA